MDRENDTSPETVPQTVVVGFVAAVSYTHLDVYKRQVRLLAGPTNGRLAAPGTIRGDYSMSFQSA